jgi:hypothetical protein
MRRDEEGRRREREGRREEGIQVNRRGKEKVRGQEGWRGEDRKE